jgi:GNAT superfamily N-acetyltransferase
VKFVRPKIKDIERIQELVSESFEISRSFAKQVYSENKLMQLFGKKLSFMLVDNNAVLGVICGSPDSENPVVVWMDLLLVSKSLHRRGFGTKIIRYFEKYLVDHRYGQVILFTETVNPEARAFYQKSGYVQVGNLSYLPGLERVFYKKVINKKIISDEYNKYKRFL